MKANNAVMKFGVVLRRLTFRSCVSAHTRKMMSSENSSRERERVKERVGEKTLQNFQGQTQ